MKKLYAYILITLFFFVSYSLTFAQPQPVQDALSSAQESESELAEAKDKESPFTLSQRIKTFQDVIDLSLSEAKDLKVKLLSIDLEDKNIETWREKAVNDLNNAIDYYKENKEYINTNQENLNESDVIEKARTFKNDWSGTYSPLHEEVQNFILMNKSEEVAKIAQNRFEKIRKDLSIIKNSGIGETDQLEELLENARILLEESKEENKQAMDLFLESIEPEKVNVSTSTATSTDSNDNVTSTDITTSTDNIVTSSVITSSTQPQSTSSDETASTTENSSSTASIMMVNTESSTSTATTTPTASSTAVASESLESIPDSLELSIRDLVGSSLQNVRGSYHIFIEMSNFVRELLK